MIRLFVGPPVVLAIMAFVVPIILNPWILGWPFLRQPKKPKLPRPQSKSNVAPKKDALGREIVDIPTFMNAAKELNSEMERVQNRPNVELGSLATKEFTVGSPHSRRKQVEAVPFYLKSDPADRQRHRNDAIGRMQAGPNQYLQSKQNNRGTKEEV